MVVLQVIFTLNFQDYPNRLGMTRHEKSKSRLHTKLRAPKRLVNNMHRNNNFVEKIRGCSHPFMIAEIGINHNGDIQLAKEMIDAAVENGADCVKFQSFAADKYISPSAARAEYQDQPGFESNSQRDIISACELTPDEMYYLKSYADGKNVAFLSTPFEKWSLRHLVEMRLEAIKVSSCNLTNIDFLRELAATELPVLLSTGMSNLQEVTTAVQIFEISRSPLLLFQCTSNYPSNPANANLKVLQTYQQLFSTPVGLSDHTTSNTTSIAAVALGAVAIEKHFTLSKTLPGIDQKASLEPNELKSLVKDLHECYSALGSPLKFRAAEEENTAAALRRSLFAAKDIKTGHVFDEECVIAMRPGTGISPDKLSSLVGKIFARDVAAGKMISMEDVKS